MNSMTTPSGYWGGYFLKELTMDPLGMGWVTCFRTHNELTMDPLGILVLAPSVRSRWGCTTSSSSLRNSSVSQGAKPCILDQKTVQKLFRKEQKVVPFSCLKFFNWNLENYLLFAYPKNSMESKKSCIQFSITFSTLEIKIYDTIFWTLNIKWKKK